MITFKISPPGQLVRLERTQLNFMNSMDGWVEAAPAAVGLRPATTQTRPATAPPVKGRKRRHLLATLRTLEAASLSQKSPSPPGSDSEEEEEEVGRKKKYLQRPSLANASKEVGEKRKRKCQKQVSSISDTEGKCHTQTLLGGISAKEEKGKKKCQKYSHSHPTQHLNGGINSRNLNIWSNQISSQL